MISVETPTLGGSNLEVLENRTPTYGDVASSPEIPATDPPL